MDVDVLEVVRVMEEGYSDGERGEREDEAPPLARVAMEEHQSERHHRDQDRASGEPVKRPERIEKSERRERDAEKKHRRESARARRESRDAEGDGEHKSREERAENRGRSGEERRPLFRLEPQALEVESVSCVVSLGDETKRGVTV